MSKPVEPSPGAMVATAVPVNAKKRNIVVPTNSPRAATMSVVGSHVSLAPEVTQSTWALRTVLEVCILNVRVHSSLDDMSLLLLR